MTSFLWPERWAQQWQSPLTQFPVGSQTLTLANIRASGVSTRKAVATYMASQGPSIRMIMEAGILAHTSTMYGHYIRWLHQQVLVRILEKTLASIQGVNVAKIAADNACLEGGTTQTALGHQQSSTDNPQVIYWTELRSYNLSQNVYFSHFVWEIWPHNVIMNI